jgi:hypothetical protein
MYSARFVMDTYSTGKYEGLTTLAVMQLFVVVIIICIALVAHWKSFNSIVLYVLSPSVAIVVFIVINWYAVIPLFILLFYVYILIERKMTISKKQKWIASTIYWVVILALLILRVITGWSSWQQY